MRDFHEGWRGRGDEQVWKGEPEDVWRGAVTRFTQASFGLGLTSPGEREHCAHLASQLRLASPLFTAHSTEQDSTHAVTGGGVQEDGPPCG